MTYAIVKFFLSLLSPIVKLLGWATSWFNHWGRGSAQITHPSSGHVVYDPWVEVEGTQQAPSKGHYWLIAKEKDRYWPKARIDYKLGGRWKERINIGSKPGPRDATVLLVWASDYTNAFLDDHKKRGAMGSTFFDSLPNKEQLKRPDFWEPILLPKIPRSQLRVVDGIELKVEIRPQRT